MRALPIAALLLLGACGTGGSLGTSGDMPGVDVAAAALRGGSPQVALRIDDAILAKDPHNVAALLNRGDAQTALQQSDAAAESYADALQADAKSVQARIGLGRLRLADDPSAAEALFLEALQRDPRNAVALNDLGIARDLLGRHQEAQAAYRRAIGLDASMKGAQVNLALSLAMAGRADDATPLLRPLASGPNAPRKLRHDLAAVLAMAGDRSGAQRILAQDLPPDQVDQALAIFSAASPPSGPARATDAPSVAAVVPADEAPSGKSPSGRSPGGGLTGAGPTSAGPTSAGPTSAGLSSVGLTSAGPSSAGPSNAGLIGPASAGPAGAGPTSAGPTSAGLSSAGPASAGLTSAGGPASAGLMVPVSTLISNGEAAEARTRMQVVADKPAAAPLSMAPASSGSPVVPPGASSAPSAPAAAASDPAGATPPAASVVPESHAVPTPKRAADTAAPPAPVTAAPPAPVTAAPPTQAAATAPPAPDVTPSRIVLSATADTWMQVRTKSGQVLLSRVLHPGESWPVPAQPNLALSTGNAGGINILVDGASVPALGSSGAVRRDIPLDPELLKAGKLSSAARPTTTARSGASAASPVAPPVAASPPSPSAAAASALPASAAATSALPASAAAASALTASATSGAAPSAAPSAAAAGGAPTPKRAADASARLSVTQADGASGHGPSSGGPVRGGPVSGGPVSGGQVSGGPMVQLSSMPSSDGAAAAWQALQQRLPDLLADRQPVIIRAENAAGTHWRVRTAGFPGQQAANGFCSAVKAHGLDCFVTGS